MRKTPILLRDDSPLSTDCDDEEVSVIFEGYNLSGGNQKFENFATNDNDLTLITDSNKKRKLQEEIPKEIKSFSKRKLIIPSSTKSFFFDNLNNKDEHVEYDDNSAKAILDSELGVYANRKSNMRIKLSEATSDIPYESHNDPFSYSHETFIKTSSTKADSAMNNNETGVKKYKTPKKYVRKSVVLNQDKTKVTLNKDEKKKRRKRTKKSSIIMKDDSLSQSTLFSDNSGQEQPDETIDDDMKKRYQGLKFIPINNHAS